MLKFISNGGMIIWPTKRASLIGIWTRHLGTVSGLIGAGCVDWRNNKRRRKMEMDTSVTAMPQDGEHTKNLPANPQTLSRAFQPALIDRLFARLSAMYGNKFLDMWREVDMDDVKKCWADELRIFSVDHVGQAIDGLKTRNFPPTLPEFLQLCEQARKERPREYAKERTGMPTNEEMNSPATIAARERFFADAARLRPSNMGKFVEALKRGAQ